MSPATMERQGSFDQLFDNIDADSGIGGPEEVLTRGRSGRKAAGGGESNSQRSSSKSRRGKSKTRATSTTTSTHKVKVIVANDLFGDVSDSEQSCSSRGSKGSKSNNRRTRLTKTNSGSSKHSKSSTKKEKTAPSRKLVAHDIFGDSLSDINNSGDEKSVGSSHRSARHSKSNKGGADTSMSNILWHDGNNTANQREFEKMVKERSTLKKLVEDLKKENAELRKEVRNSDDDNRNLRQALADGAGNSHKLKTLEEENKRLQVELRDTIDRASTMVKDRETATDQLLEELEKLRQETKQTRTMFDATLFKNKQKTEELDHQNDQYAKRIQELEQRLEGLNKKRR